MKSKFTLFFFALFLTYSFSQTLGIYEFTGTGACPNQSTSITTQPSGATFSAFSSTGTVCVVTNNVYNTSGWNPATTIDLTKYYEFSLTASNGKLLQLDSLIFASRISTNTATWYLRSDIDAYATDIATGNNTNVLDTFRIELPSSHQDILSVNFRFYVSSVTDDQRAWRIDDVTTKGLVVDDNANVSELGNDALVIFPNPGTDIVNFNFADIQDQLVVKIISSTGKTIHSVVFESTNFCSLNTSQLSEGIYFFQIQNKNEAATFRWVKK